MKCIIIIIALFLVTLTAKADWVKSGELDSLYLGDAPITFSKYSPDYTKFVTYSAQDSTLRLWDLGTGKVIKERTFEWNYSFKECEFDFKNEMFYFHTIQGQIYPNSLETKKDKDQILWYINFNDSLNYLVLTTGGFYSSGYGGGYQYNTLNKLIFQDSIISVCYFYESTYTPNGTTTTSYGGSIIHCKIQNSKLVILNKYSPDFSTIIKFEYGYFSTINNGSHTTGTHGGPVDYFTSSSGFYINFGNSSIQVKDPNLNYPYLKFISPRDIAFNCMAFNDTNYKIMLYSKEEDKLFNLKIAYKSNEIRNFKLIQSPQYSMFYKELNKLIIYDNRKIETISTFYLPEGKLGYDNSKNIAYSNKDNNLYKVSTNLNNRGFVDLYVKKNKYVIGDTVNVFIIVSNKFKDGKLDIDNKLYLDSIAVFKSNKIGIFGAKFSYFEDNVFKIFSTDSLFEVRDSLRATYKVTHDYDNNVKFPFHCEAISNDSSTVFTWSYSWCTTYYVLDRDGIKIPKYSNYTNKENGNNVKFYIDKEINLTNCPLKLNVNNGFQNLTYYIDIKVMPNLNIEVNKYRGFAPFNFKIVFDQTILYHTSTSSFYPCDGGPFEKQLLIGSSIKFTKFGNSIDTLNLTIEKPGIYPITLKYLKYLGGITVVHDSVLTVLDPADTLDTTSYPTDTLSIDRFVFKDFDTMAYIKGAKNAEIKIFNQIGQLIREYNLTGDLYLQKEEFDRGLYFVKIQYGSTNLIKKFLVE